MLRYKNQVSIITKTLMVIFLISQLTSCQTYKLKTDGYPVINDKTSFYKFAETLPLGITEKDDYQTILSKVDKYLENYKPVKPDDYFSLNADKAALEGCMKGGYGIGAILVNPKGEIIESAYNSMIQMNRSDLHGEMTLMDKFESNPENNKYRNGYTMKPGYIVYSSAEPCPMCMIRLATAKVDTKYNCKNDNNSLTRYMDNFPSFWKQLCSKYPCKQADCSKELSDVAYLLFYLYVIKDVEK